MKRGEVDSTGLKLRKGKYSRPETPEAAPLTQRGNNASYISNGVPYILETNYRNVDRAPTRFVERAIARTAAKFRR